MVKLLVAFVLGMMVPLALGASYALYGTDETGETPIHYSPPVSQAPAP
jgi:hypothetical protein